MAEGLAPGIQGLAADDERRSIFGPLQRKCTWHTVITLL